MRYKSQILNLVESIDNQISTITRRLQQKAITEKEVTEILNEWQKKLESVANFVELESDNPR